MAEEYFGLNKTTIIITDPDYTYDGSSYTEGKGNKENTLGSRYMMDYVVQGNERKSRYVNNNKGNILDKSVNKNSKVINENKNFSIDKDGNLQNEYSVFNQNDEGSRFYIGKENVLSQDSAAEHKIDYKNGTKRETKEVGEFSNRDNIITPLNVVKSVQEDKNVNIENLTPYNYTGDFGKFGSSTDNEKSSVSTRSSNNYSNVSAGSNGFSSVEALKEDTNIDNYLASSATRQSRNISVVDGASPSTSDASETSDNFGIIRSNVDRSVSFITSQDYQTSNAAVSAFQNSAVGGIVNGTLNSLVSDAKSIAKSTIVGKAISTAINKNAETDAITKIKSKKYKEIHTSFKNGTYATISNLIGIAAGMYVGSLGKSETALLLDDLGSQVGSSLGVATILSKITSGGLTEIAPTAEEATLMATATYSTVQTSKPGRTVRDNFTNSASYNFITGETYSDFTSKSGANKNVVSDISNTIANSKVGKVLSTVSNFSLTSMLSSITKKIGANTTYTYTTIGKIDDIVRSENNYTKIAELDGDFTLKSTPRMGPTKENGKIKNLTKDEYGNYLIPALSKDLENEASPRGLWSRWQRAEVFNRVNSEFRNIGGLYIEPFYNNEGLNCFEIPFEFNPEISDGGQIANYEKTEIMGRILGIRSYIGSDSNEVTVETTYIATAPNDLSKWKNNKEDRWLNGWMSDWTPRKLQQIERYYRALTLPAIYPDKEIFVRPPIIRIKMHTLRSGQTTNENIEYVGDLFKYPNAYGTTHNVLQATYNFASNGDSNASNTREKRYVCTSVSISPLDDWSTSYINEGFMAAKGDFDNANKPELYEPSDNFRGYDENGDPISSDEYDWHGYRRYGFKVSLTLAETTRSFLDIIPTYAEYVSGQTPLSVDGSTKGKLTAKEAADSKGNINLDETTVTDVSINTENKYVTEEYVYSKDLESKNDAFGAYTGDKRLKDGENLTITSLLYKLYKKQIVITDIKTIK